MADSHSALKGRRRREKQVSFASSEILRQRAGTAAIAAQRGLPVVQVEDGFVATVQLGGVARGSEIFRGIMVRAHLEQRKPDRQQAEAAGICHRRPARVRLVAVFLRINVGTYCCCTVPRVDAHRRAFPAVAVTFVRAATIPGEAIKASGQAQLQPETRQRRQFRERGDGGVDAYVAAAVDEVAETAGEHRREGGRGEYGLDMNLHRSGKHCPQRHLLEARLPAGPTHAGAIARRCGHRYRWARARRSAAARRTVVGCRDIPTRGWPPAAGRNKAGNPPWRADTRLLSLRDGAQEEWT